MSFRQTTFFCLAASCWLIGAAQAQQPSAEQANAIRASCRSDFMANCSSVQPGGADAIACLRRNLAKLSGPCQTAVSAITPAAPTAAPPAVAKPQGAAKPATAAKPVPRPAAELNPAPPPAAAPAVAPLDPRPFIMPERRLAILAICHADAEKLCPPSLPADRMRCLAAQASSLSAPCYDAIARVSR